VAAGKSGSAIALAEQAARIQTIGTARACLGYATEVLHTAYEAIDLIDVATFEEGGAFQAGINQVFGITGSIKDELRSSIDIARAYAEGIYATYAAATPDLFDQEISTLNSTRVAFALQRSLTALNSVVEAIENPSVTSGEDFVQGISDLLDTLITKAAAAAASIVQGAANAAATVLSAFAVPLAIVGVVVVGIIAWRAGAFKGGAA
jgi:hypothetical protein